MQNKNRFEINNIVYIISTQILLLGLLARIILQWEIARWVLLPGALLYLWAVIAYRPKQDNLRIKRLLRLAHFSGLLWLAGAISMFMQSELWIIFFFVACVFMVYSNIALSCIVNKSSKTKDDLQQ